MKCGYCGSGMIAGFFIFDGEYYFCSEDCLYIAYIQKEAETL